MQKIEANTAISKIRTLPRDPMESLERTWASSLPTCIGSAINPRSRIVRVLKSSSDAIPTRWMNPRQSHSPGIYMSDICCMASSLTAFSLITSCQ
eukprot:8015349-Karenia_brevis.AAC.1